MSLELIALYAGRNEIEDEGIKVLKKAFITDGFAPRLQILWLSVNLITRFSGYLSISSPTPEQNVLRFDFGLFIIFGKNCLVVMCFFNSKLANVHRKRSSIRSRILSRFICLEIC